MNNKEKIVNILINELDYCYCDNCEYGDDEDYPGYHCADCHHKYSNWSLSEKTALRLAEEINACYEPIILFLIQALEDEHMGCSWYYCQAIEEKYGVKI